MRRLLILVVALAVARAAMAAPAYACVAPMSSISSQHHTCCDEPAVAAAPLGVCCVVTGPVQRLSSTEVQQAKPDQRGVVIARGNDSLRPPRHDWGPSASPPTLRVSSVPLYLQQLSLLI